MCAASSYKVGKTLHQLELKLEEFSFKSFLSPSIPCARVYSSEVLSGHNVPVLHICVRLARAACRRRRRPGCDGMHASIKFLPKQTEPEMGKVDSLLKWDKVKGTSFFVSKFHICSKRYRLWRGPGSSARAIV